MIDAAFAAASTLALAGWVVLIGFPSWHRARARVVGLAIPAILAAAYAVVFPPLFAQAPGGFGSVEDLVALMTFHPGLVLAGWLHYLAFDLLVGRMILERSQALGIPHGWMVAPLLLCFLCGPIGWLLFVALEALWPRLGARQNTA